jgi:NADPH:quinone reductase-like Zn-dependent oxidoreductase
MKAITITRQGSPVAPNVKVVSDWPEPQPRAGEALVRTEASALNHLDLWVGMGMPGLDLTYPRIGGSDGAGMVESVGEGVDASWVGRRVLLNAAIPKAEPHHPEHLPAPPDIIMIGEHVNGTMAEKFIAPAGNLIDIGATDPVEAAAFGLTFLTAWRMLVSRARLHFGQSMLITGIGGGVALACLAIARHFGCTTIVTSRHQWKLDRAKELGAEHGVLDTGDDWSKQVRALTGKRGVDIVADSVGKAVHLSCIKSLARGGTLVTCGNTSGPDATTDLTRIFWNQLSILGSTMGDMVEFRSVVSLLRIAALKPVIDQVFAPADAQKAYARLESAEQFGKIVIRW